MKRQDGGLRRVGVEIEFAAVSCAEAAALVAALFGGTTAPESEFRIAVEKTAFGDFLVELDNQYAHAEAAGGESLTDQFDRWRAKAVGRLSESFVPLEIVSPPIDLIDLPKLEDLIAGLRELRAQDTRDSIVFGFGMQLNPEAPSLAADSIRAHLQAFVLLEDWLRRQIDVDTTRRLLPFAAPFPEAYGDRILAAGYGPDLDHLIDDYLTDNPTRNRSLDMLPLFHDLDPERIEAKMDTSLIKPRPTYHYRLPDCRLSDPTWGLATEWNRWAAVERLAADPDALERLAAQRAERNETSGLERLQASVVEWFGGT